MKQYNCKNCGAPVEHTYNHRCKYCDSILDFNEPEDKVVMSRPEELFDITFREQDYIPKTNGIVLIFDGYKLDTHKIYECDENDIYMSKREEYINPPRVSFSIVIDRGDLQMYGFDCIRHRFYELNISDKEIKNIEWQLVDKGIIRPLSL